MQTIREAKIVIHLESGPVNLKTPDLSGFLKQQQDQLQIVQQLEQATTRLAEAQRAVSQPTAMPTPAMPSGGAGGDYGKGLERQTELAKKFEEAIAKLIVKLNEAAKIAPPGSGGNGGRGAGLAPGAEEAEKAFARLYTSQMKYLSSQQNIAEGFFLLARSAALFGSTSDDSFDKMVRNLAMVQSYFDAYRGFTGTIKGVVEAIKALQRAEIEAAVASGNMSRAQIEALKSSQTRASGIKMLAIAISDAAVVMVAITSVLTIISSVADILIETEAEHKAAMEGVRQRNIELIRQADEQIARERQLRDARRANMDDLSKAQDLHRAVYQIDRIQRQSQHTRFNSDVPGADAALDSLNRQAYSNVSDLQAEVELRREILRTELAARDAKIDAIQQQEKQLQMAQRQLQIEEEKLQAFKSQIGALDPMTLSMLKGIDQKLKAGVDLDPFELETLQRSGGERGRREADRIYAKRFDSLGIDSETFLGGDGGAMKEAQKAVDEMTVALKDLTKELSSADAVAKLQAEKNDLTKMFEEFRAEQKKFIETLLQTIKLNNDEAKKLQEAILTN